MKVVENDPSIMRVRVHRSVRHVFWQLASLDPHLNVYSCGWLHIFPAIKNDFFKKEKVRSCVSTTVALSQNQKRKKNLS